MLRSLISITSFLAALFLDKMLFICFSNSVVLPFGGLQFKLSIILLDQLFENSKHKHSIASDFIFKSNLNL